MTLRALKEGLAAIHAHDLTETNVGHVEALPGRVVLDARDPDEDVTAGLREDLAASEEATKEAEATQAEAETERDGWEQKCMAHETHLEEMRDSEDLSAKVFDLRQDVERLIDRCRSDAREMQTMRAELSALRKRKGVEVALLAHWRDVYSLLCTVATYEGRQRDQARRLVEKIERSF